MYHQIVVFVKILEKSFHFRDYETLSDVVINS